MTNQDFAKALRELADLYDDPRMIPQDHALQIYPARMGPEEFGKMVRALGAIEKLAERDQQEYFYRIKKTLPSGIDVIFSVERSSVCRRVLKSRMVEEWEFPDQEPKS